MSHDETHKTIKITESAIEDSLALIVKYGTKERHQNCRHDPQGPRGQPRGRGGSEGLPGNHGAPGRSAPKHQGYVRSIHAVFQEKTSIGYILRHFGLFFERNCHRVQCARYSFRYGP